MLMTALAPLNTAGFCLSEQTTKLLAQLLGKDAAFLSFCFAPGTPQMLFKDIVNVKTTIYKIPMLQMTLTVRHSGSVGRWRPSHDAAGGVAP